MACPSCGETDGQKCLGSLGDHAANVYECRKCGHIYATPKQEEESPECD